MIKLHVCDAEGSVQVRDVILPLPLLHHPLHQIFKTPIFGKQTGQSPPVGRPVLFKGCTLGFQKSIVMQRCLILRSQRFVPWICTSDLALEAVRRLVFWNLAVVQAQSDEWYFMRAQCLCLHGTYSE